MNQMLDFLYLDMVSLGLQGQWQAGMIQCWLHQDRPHRSQSSLDTCAQSNY